MENLDLFPTQKDLGTSVDIALPEVVRAELSAGALFVINHSGGKDSQAMTLLLQKLLPADQVLVVHAKLPQVDWDGIPEHIEATLPTAWPLVYTQAGKTFFELVRQRFEKRPEVPSFPSPSQRFCTSDLKRGPIDKTVRHYLKAHPEFKGRVVHCVGKRAEESPARAKEAVWKCIPSASLQPYSLLPGGPGAPDPAQCSSRARTVHHWLPIHALGEAQVFNVIRDAGQQPHWAYRAGMTRLSCCFCIMASKRDLTTAARLAPDKYIEMVELEKTTGYTLSMSKKPLEAITGIQATQADSGNPTRVLKPGTDTPVVRHRHGRSVDLSNQTRVDHECNRFKV